MEAEVSTPSPVQLLSFCIDLLAFDWNYQLVRLFLVDLLMLPFATYSVLTGDNQGQILINPFRYHSQCNKHPRKVMDKKGKFIIYFFEIFDVFSKRILAEWPYFPSRSRPKGHPSPDYIIIDSNIWLLHHYSIPRFCSIFISFLGTAPKCRNVIISKAPQVEGQCKANHETRAQRMVGRSTVGFWGGNCHLKWKLQEAELQFILFACFQVLAGSMMDNAQADSLEEPKTTSLPTNSELLTPRNSPGVDYVGQYMQDEEKNGRSEFSSCLSNEKRSVSEENLPSGSSESPSNSENSTFTRPSKSLFHNFQKHLVTTLKMGISISKTNNKNDPTIHLAQRMWRLFQKSNYFSKRVLYFLFGVDGGSPQPPFEGFSEVASIYPQYEIELAQQYLREEVSRQGKRLLSRSLLSHRRMQRGEEFQVYFQKFLEEIEGGAISRRLPKATKLQLLGSLNKQ